MTKLRFTAAALTIAAFSGFSVSTAQSPTNRAVGQQLPAGQPSTLSGQAIQQQPGSPTAQTGQHPTYQASGQSQQEGLTVKEAIVQKLIKANEAEIELAKLAQQKSDNEELKQLASTIIKDHQQLNQTMQQHAGNRSSSGHSESGLTNQNQKVSGASHSQSATVPEELCKIAEQACENALKMNKEMLGNYEGQDFNMAFLGQQCVAHTMMLAELNAIESNGPKELQQLASEAANKVESHLDQAKKLAKKLEDDRKSRS